MTATQGFCLLDKPAGLTSHDVVAKARRALRQRRVGHAGTLDPMATGVLILGVGRATRLLSLVADADKTYTAVIRLGQSTSTDDAEGELQGETSAASISEATVRCQLPHLTGTISQRPSSVSAIKVNGVRAYKLAFDGNPVDLPARSVHIASFQLHSCQRPTPQLLDLQVTVSCSSGTYIRALARDLGEMLGVGAHLTELRRTRIGQIQVGQCLPLADFLAEPQVESISAMAAQLNRALPVTATQATELSFGRAIDSDMGESRPSAPDLRIAIDETDCAVALVGRHDNQWQPKAVLIEPRTGE